MAKPKCVLLDAGPVIALHYAGVWEQFCKRYDVVVPEIVADNGALWHSKDEVTSARNIINLRDAKAKGLISIEAASTGELHSLTSRFDDVFARGLPKASWKH